MSLPEHLEVYPEIVAAYNHALVDAEANTVPTPDELGEEWASIYDPGVHTVDAGEVYGTMRVSSKGEKIWGVASIDLCEVTPRYVWNEDHDDLNHVDTPKNVSKPPMK